MKANPTFHRYNNNISIDGTQRQQQKQKEGEREGDESARRWSTSQTKNKT